MAFRKPLHLEVQEEIALEGLEGVTLSDLYVRLCHHNGPSFKITPKFKDLVWKCVVSSPLYTCYTLPEPRPPLQIKTRAELDSKAPMDNPPVVYKFTPINSKGVRGSCQDFKERVEVSKSELENVSWEQVLGTYDQRLVIVASQKVREAALFYKKPEKHLSITMYCALEKIGRSRSVGETINGTYSLMDIFKEIMSRPNYYLKNMVEMDLIVKQDDKTGEGGPNRSLFHLPRYFKENKAQLQILILNALQFLKSQPNATATMGELRDACMGDRDKASRIFKHSDFSPHVNRYTVPYREYYPNSTPREYLCKNKTEKVVYVCRLKNPDLDIYNAFKREEPKESESGFLDTSNLIMGLSLTRQVYLYLKRVKEKGANVRELRTYFGLTKLNCRTIINGLKRSGLIHTSKVEDGRQSITACVLKIYKDVMKTPAVKALAKLEAEPVEEVKEEEEPKVCFEGMDLSVIATEIVFTKTFKGISENLPSIRKDLESKTVVNKAVNRANIILRLVSARRVVSEYALRKRIGVLEKRAGYKEEVCGKFLKRMMSRLAQDNYIKLLTLKLIFEGMTKEFDFACALDVTENDEVVLNTVDSFKAKHAMKKVYEEHPILSVTKGRLAFSLNLEENELVQFRLQAKFVRLRRLHEFLFVATHRTSQPLRNRREILNAWMAQNSSIPSDTVLEDLPPIYDRSLDWKTFVEPLPSRDVHSLDVILSHLPICLVAILIALDLRVPELRELLLHPIKRFITIKYAPNVIRAMITYHRRTINAMQVNAKMLGYVGVLKLVSSDGRQDLVYLNRNASLYDTTSSAPGYHTVENKPYPQLSFSFETLEDVEKYWTSMVSICSETRLNSRSTGQEVLVEGIGMKKKLDPQIQAKSLEECRKRDDGTVPGDHLGAAGLDSALYPHLPTNWLKKRNTSMKNKKLAMAKKKILFKNSLHRSKPVIHPKKKQNRHQPVRRNLQPKVKKRVRSDIYDNIDKQALKQMSNLRANWTPEEDQILLMCRLASMYFRPKSNIKKNVRAHVRDILHWRFPYSNSKTSMACLRRQRGLLKQKETSTVVQFCLAELWENETVKQRYGEDFMTNLGEIYQVEKELAFAFKIHFVNFVYLLIHIYKNLSAKTDSVADLELPDSIMEFYSRYRTTLSAPQELPEDPHQKEEIETHQLESLIHSFMCSVKDKTAWNFQFYEVFEKYSEEVVRRSMYNLRSRQIVSLNKSVKTKHLETVRKSMTLPMHLSITYVNQVATKVPYEAFDQVFQTYLDFGGAVVSGDNDFELYNSTSGAAILLAEMVNKKMLRISMEPPKLVLRMENIQAEHFASYERIYPRFHELMKHMKINEVRPDPLPGTSKASASETPGRKSVRFGEAITYKYQSSPLETLMKMDSGYYHFFCLLRSLHQEILSQTFFLDDTGCCSLNCVLAQSDPIDAILAISKAHKPALSNMQGRKVLREKHDFLHKNYVIKEDTLMYFYGQLIQRLQKDLEPLRKKDVGETANVEVDANYVLSLVISVNAVNEHKLVSFLKKFEVTRTPLLKGDQEATLDDEEDRQIEITDRQVNKHADIFMLNLGKMNMALSPELDRTRECVEEFEVPRCLMFLPPRKKEEVLETIKKRVHLTVLQRNLTDLRKVVRQKRLAKEEKEAVEALFETVKAQGVSGVQAPDLPKILQLNKSLLKKSVDFLIEYHFIIRSGTTNVTYIHSTFAHPWLISSYHMKWPDRESIPTSSSSLTQIPKPSTSRVDSSDFGKRMAELDEGYLPKPKRAKVSLEKQLQDEAREERQEEQKIQSREGIWFIAKPWIRVNGSVNRRALDKWMGTIMMYLMYHPGITLAGLGKRFHFLTVVQIRDLLDILADLGCVELMTISTPTAGLFEEYELVPTQLATDFDDIQQIFVKVLPGAITKFTLFLGKKKYTTEFL